MSEQKEITSEIGHVIFPETGEKIDFALLKITESEILLEFPTDSLRASSVKMYDIILGVFNNVGHVTLIECNYYGSQYGNAANVLRLDAKFILIGIHISVYEDIKFSKMVVCFPLLFSWINQRIVTPTADEAKPIKIIYPDDIVLADLEDYKLSITHYLNHNFGGENIQYSQDTCFKVSKKEEDLSLWSLLKVVDEFKKLIMLFINSYANIDWISVYTEKLLFGGTSESKEKMLEVKLVIASNLKRDTMLPYSPSLEFKDIELDLKSICEAWYNNGELSASSNLILEKLFNLGLSNESFFLNSCFAIETYHRRFKKFQVFSKSEFKELKKQILSGIVNDDDKDFINQKLSHANEPSFRDRLESLSEDFSKILNDSINVSDYIGGIVKTRNYLVHRGSKKNVFDQFDLYFVASYIGIIVKMNVFRELGVVEKVINDEFLKAQNTMNSLYEQNKKRQQNSR